MILESATKPFLIGAALDQTFSWCRRRHRILPLTLLLLQTSSLALGGRRGRKSDDVSRRYATKERSARLRKDLERLLGEGHTFGSIRRESGVAHETLSRLQSGNVRTELRTAEKLEAAFRHLEATIEPPTFVSDAANEMLRRELKRFTDFGYSPKAIALTAKTHERTVTDFLSGGRTLSGAIWMKLNDAAIALDKELEEREELIGRIQRVEDSGCPQQLITNTLGINKKTWLRFLDARTTLSQGIVPQVRAKIETLEAENEQRIAAEATERAELAGLRHQVACIQELGYSLVALGRSLGTDYHVIDRLLSVDGQTRPETLARVRERLPGLHRRIVIYQEALNSIIQAMPAAWRDPSSEPQAQINCERNMARELDLPPALLARALSGDAVNDSDQAKLIAAVRRASIPWTRSGIVAQARARISRMVDVGFSFEDIAQTLGMREENLRRRIRQHHIAVPNLETQVVGRARRLAAADTLPSIRSWDQLSLVLGLQSESPVQFRRAIRTSNAASELIEPWLADASSEDQHAVIEEVADEAFRLLLDGRLRENTDYRHHLRDGMVRIELIGRRVGQDNLTASLPLDENAPSIVSNRAAPFVLVREVDRVDEKPLAYFTLHPRKEGLVLQRGHAGDYEPSEAFERWWARAQLTKNTTRMSAGTTASHAQTAKIVAARLSPVFFRSRLRTNINARLPAYETAVAQVQAIDPTATASAVTTALSDAGANSQRFHTYRSLDLHFGRGHISRRFVELAETERTFPYAFVALFQELKSTSRPPILNAANLEQVLLGYGHLVMHINTVYNIHMEVLRVRAEDIFDRYEEIKANSTHEFEAYEAWDSWLDRLALDLPLLEKTSNRGRCLELAGLARARLSARVAIYRHWVDLGVNFEEEVKRRESMGRRELVGNLSESLRNRGIGLPNDTYSMSFSFYVEAILQSLGLLVGLEPRGRKRVDLNIPVLRADLDLLLQDGLLDQRLHAIAWQLIQQDSPAEIAADWNLSDAEYDLVVENLRQILASNNVIDRPNS